MPDECERTLEYRIYRRTGPAIGLNFTRSPTDAPDPRKSMEDVKAELEKSVDDDVAKRNARPEQQCDPCGLVKVKEGVETFYSEGRRQWSEEYSLNAPDGTVVNGTAVYSAWSQVPMEVMIRTRICGPASFGDRFAMLSGIELRVDGAALAALDYGVFVKAANRDPLALKALGAKPALKGKKNKG